QSHASAFRYEKDRGQRRDGQAEFGDAAFERVDCAAIADIAAAITRGVGIEHFLPPAGKRHPDAVVLMDTWGEVHDHETARVRVKTLAQPGEDVFAGIMGDDPFESRLIAIHL